MRRCGGVVSDWCMYVTKRRGRGIEREGAILFYSSLSIVESRIASMPNLTLFNANTKFY